MQLLLSLTLLASGALATPMGIAVRQETNIATRATGITSNEYSVFGCRDVIFFFARGSTEVGNMGSTVGPPTSDGLKDVFGETNVATEGIVYAALLSTNFNPGGADYAGIALMRSQLIDAAEACPDSKLVAGGYSQGAALTHRAIEDLPDAVKQKIVGVITYGDTQNQQDGGQIPNFPRDKIKVICNVGDLVCEGTLIIAAPHLAYTPRVGEAVSFLVGKIQAA